ncbi:hypothetical protein [Ochrovirga pacifica]|uniref:hypothetical protein n=1 Tax=Ochrovirga pacifica TaxID=1042376 RepID=UPI0002558B2F|nr:hypothetical protein [Ochrovirga pacifica]
MRVLQGFVFCLLIACHAQTVQVVQKIDLPKKVNETSGIVYVPKENRIITFNDSGGKPELYLISTQSGKLKKTVKVSNADNVDWESITQDDTYIYVGDTGNNNGNRTDLIIYKVLLKDVLEKEKVKADKIRFSYEDQINFKKQRHTSNFDCEAITVYQNQLLLFTKNWGDFRTNVYKIPTTEGTYTAHKQKSFKIDCMLTSIAYHPQNKTFIGTAYHKDYQSYLIQINEFQWLQNQFTKIPLQPVLGPANQTEAIAWIDKKQVFISREASKVKQDGKKYHRKQKLIQLTLP